LARALQERLTEPFYSLGLDTFINMTPARYFGAPDGRATANKAVSILPYTIRTFSDMGLHTIVDHVFMKIDNLMDECIELLHEYPVMFVHVTCPLEENLRRAKERGANPEAIMRQIPLLIPQEPYDLTIDTTDEACVEKVIEFQNYPEKFTAFKTLWTQKTL
jgi:chloramphenicol 3-O phosphotransferase